MSVKKYQLQQKACTRDLAVLFSFSVMLIINSWKEGSPLSGIVIPTLWYRLGEVGVYEDLSLLVGVGVVGRSLRFS